MSDQLSNVQPQFLTVGEGEASREIAMLVRPAQAGNGAPALVWLSGYRSDMSGTKAVELLLFWPIKQILGRLTAGDFSA
ncbi:hypothetical protein ACCS86_37660, partial [Rhizobium ruizarguesonis]